MVDQQQQAKNVTLMYSAGLQGTYKHHERFTWDVFNTSYFPLLFQVWNKAFIEQQ